MVFFSRSTHKFHFYGNEALLVGVQTGPHVLSLLFLGGGGFFIFNTESKLVKSQTSSGFYFFWRGREVLHFQSCLLSNLSSHCGVCLLACGQIVLCKKLTPDGCSGLKDTP